MLSRTAQALANLEEARRLRASGTAYRDIRRRLGISAAQLGLIRRTLRREKAGETRMRSTAAGATHRDLPIARSALPAGLRRTLAAAGYRRFGDLADLIDAAGPRGLEALPGIGPHRAALIKRLLDHFGLLAGAGDLQGEVEALFPELGGGN